MAGDGKVRLGTAFCLTMGCSKNGVDSEKIAGLLRESGFEIVPEARGAEICIINTCGFIRSAVEENIESILEMTDLKSRGCVLRVGVVGCLVNRYGADVLAKEVPEVDFWAKSEDYGAITRAIGKNSGTAGAICDKSLKNVKRLSLPGSASHVRYLKLSEGCDNRCAFCAIPSIRGGLKSVALDALVEEAMNLAAEGAREICLVGQDLTAYGRDLGVRDALPKLLDALESSLPADIWLRLLYLQPRGVGKKLLERVAFGRQTLPYLDIPIQHASPKVLSLMNRSASYENLLGIFRTARDIRPDFALRTTCIVGFPGEKREDFDLLLRFLEEAQLDRVGAFIFSPEEGTPAADMPNQVALRTKKARMDRLMTMQEDISLGRQALFVGHEFDVVIDSAARDGVAEGRSFREAPEVDGVIEIRDAREELRPGDRIKALVTDAFEHDMAAREVA